MKWVIVQIIIFACLIFLPNSNDIITSDQINSIPRVFFYIGMLILFTAIFNLRHSLNVSPEPNRNGKLEVNGIYKYIRNPMYTSVFMIMLSVTINSQSLYKFFIYLVLVLFFVVKTEHEEKQLAKKYPDYVKYQKKTGKYLPKLRSSK